MRKELIHILSRHTNYALSDNQYERLNQFDTVAKPLVHLSPTEIYGLDLSNAWEHLGAATFQDVYRKDFTISPTSQIILNQLFYKAIEVYEILPPVDGMTLLQKIIEQYLPRF